MKSNAHISVLADAIGALAVIYMLTQEGRAARRIGVAGLILSGLDGLLKMRFLGSASTLELAYQVPWILLGICACWWIADPPRVGLPQRNERIPDGEA